MNSKPTRILLIEDNPAHSYLVDQLLAEQGIDAYRLVTAERLSDAINILQTSEIDVVLTDLLLPDAQDLRTVNAIFATAPHLPIVVLSSLRDENLAIQAMQAGAQDYLVKGRFDAELLSRTIRYSIERKRSEDMLQRTLTDLETRVHERTAALEATNSRLLQEIAERNQAEQSLRESESRLIQYLDAVPLGIYVHDADGKPYFSNKTAQDFLGHGVARDAELGDLSEVYHLYLAGTDELYPTEQLPVTRALAGERGTIDDMEFRSSSRAIPVEVSWAPVYTEDQQITFAITAFSDISERKQAEQQVLLSERRFRALFENGLDCMLILDDNAVIVDANMVAAQLFAVDPAQLRDHALGDLVAEVDAEKTLELWDLLMQDGEIAVEQRFQVAPGRELDFEITAKANFIPHYHLALVRDVTARREGEQALLAREAAERANHAKSEFLSHMSHELRTPLNSILGFAQLMALEELTAEQNDNLNYIIKGGRHLLSLINEVLDIARVEAGRLSISPEPVAVREVLQESLDLILPLAAQRGISVEEEGLGAAGSFHVSADRQRLIQVLLNLLSNAVKYNHDAGVIALVCERYGSNRFRIGVRDSGPGIPEQKQHLLFTPFERLGAEQSAVEGTGLGLAMSKMLTEAMGGSLSVESVAGAGATFWVELALVEAPSLQLQRKGTGPLRAPTGNEAAYTVLYIEDNPASMELVERLIEQRPGIKLLSSHSGLGIELARQHLIDLVLLDIHLPDLAGDEALRRLKADPKTSAIPVVVLSADATPLQVERLLAEGAYDYMTKPLDVHKFFQLLEAILPA